MGLTVVDLLSIPLTIVAYVLTALSLYTIAKRRGIKRPWLAWIPVADMWVLGCISDQYRYVTRGQVTTRRRSMLILNIVWTVLLSWSMVMLVVMFFQFMPYLPEEFTTLEGMTKIGMMSEEEQTAFIESLPMEFSTPTPQMTQMIAVEACIIAIPALVGMVCLVIQTVLMYKCYYDLFLAAEPMSATMRLTLSIVGAFMGFGILRPIFLFTCRDQDAGMPPRGYREQPVIPMPTDSGSNMF